MTKSSDRNKSTFQWPKGIAAPAQRALAAAGITSLEQLAIVKESDLSRLHGIGPKALGILRAGLAEQGLAFADDPIVPGTAGIYNFIRISDRTLTGGQPTAEQLRAAADEGVTAVINLATYSPGHSLEGEAELVRSLGMTYVHIPVDWSNPTDADLAAFEKAMQQLGDDRLLIHCAANYRVTAFYSLHARNHLGWTEAQAEALRARIWSGSDYPVWEAFISRKTAEMSDRE